MTLEILQMIANALVKSLLIIKWLRDSEMSHDFVHFPLGDSKE